MFPLYHVVSMKHLYVSCFFCLFSLEISIPYRRWSDRSSGVSQEGRSVGQQQLGIFHGSMVPKIAMKNRYNPQFSWKKWDKRKLLAL